MHAMKHSRRTASLLLILALLTTLAGSLLVNENAYADPTQCDEEIAIELCDDNNGAAGDPPGSQGFCESQGLGDWTDCVTAGGAALLCWVVTVAGGHWIATIICGGLSAAVIECCL